MKLESHSGTPVSSTVWLGLLIVSLVLNAIVAVGNWNLYARVEKLETTLSQQAMPQSPQISSQGRQQ